MVTSSNHWAHAPDEASFMEDLEFTAGAEECRDDAEEDIPLRAQRWLLQQHRMLGHEPPASLARALRQR